MLYALAHILREKCPWVWDAIEAVNSWLFGWLYGRKLLGMEEVVGRYQQDYVVEELKEGDVEALVRFFEEQPEEAFTYFKPHGFDEKSLLKLIKRKSFLMFMVRNHDEVVGYFFLRCFASGKTFRGRIVDFRHQNQGIGKLMGNVINEVAQYLRLRQFSSISPENYSSLASAKAVSEVKIIRVLENGYYYIECKPKSNKDGEVIEN